MGGNKIDVLRSSCDVFNVRIEQRDRGPGRLSKEILCGSIFSNLYFLLLQRIQFEITDAPDQDQVKTKESYLGDHIMDFISSSSFRLHHILPKTITRTTAIVFHRRGANMLPVSITRFSPKENKADATSPPPSLVSGSSVMTWGFV